MKKALIPILILLFASSAWATPASKTPAPGTVPISRSDSTIDPGFLPATGKYNTGIYYCKTEADLIAAIADGTKPLIQITASFTLTGNRTIASGQTLWMPGNFAINRGGFILGIYGYFPRPGGYLIFTGSGTTVFGSGSLDYTADPAWFAGGASEANTAAANVIVTLTQNSATPSVSTLGGFNGTYKTNNSTATTITNFIYGVAGQKFTLIIGDTYTSIQFGTNILSSGVGSSLVTFNSGDSLNFVYDGTNWHCVTMPVQNYTMYRNRLINGEMRIDQRRVGASQTINTADSGDTLYRVDRWFATASGANLTGQQVSGAGQWKNYFQITGAGSNTAFTFGQRIESINIQDLASTTATLSIYLSSTTLTTITWTAYYANSTDNWGAQTQISTGTWTITSGAPARYSATVALPANAVNGVSVVISGVNFTSGTLSITGAQFESGLTPSTFERRPDDIEIIRCARYCPTIRSASYASGGPVMWAQIMSSTTAMAIVQFLAPARTNPTAFVIRANSDYTINKYDGTATSYALSSTTMGAASQYGCTLQVGFSTMGGSPAAGMISWVGLANASNALYFTGCEL